MNELRAQLVPSWSGVNIGIMILLFITVAPLGILMLGYIIWGKKLGLDLSQPQSFVAAGGRLGTAFGAAKQSWSGATPLPTGTPNGARNAQRELDEERAQLEREKSAFEAEKRAFPHPLSRVL